METILKNLCGAAVLALCSITAASAATESYPNKTITLIVPFAPGGPADIMGRTIAKNLADDLGQAIVVVNKAGAGGNIGTDALAKSNPDGYTLGISLISSLAIAPSLYSKLPYDVKRDIAPISMVGIATPAILAHPSAPFNTFDEMIRYAKAHPGTLNYSTPGVGTAPHLAAEYLSSLAGIDLVHVPYKGTAPASQDLLAGVIPMGFESSLVTASKFVDSGKLKAIAVLTKDRSDLLPKVPTVSELGYPGFDAANWFCLVAPANTPPQIIEKLNRLTAAALKTPAIVAKFAEIGVVAQSMSPAELAAYIDKETKHWREIIVANNIKAE